jgi:DNA-binding protein HU-beta
VPPDIGVIQEEELSMAKAATPTTVTLKHMAAALAQAHEMAKKQSEMILGDFVSLMVKHLKKGDRLRISGLGILQVRKRAARMGRNPATGEAIKIKASKKVAFRAAKELKEHLSEGGMGCLDIGSGSPCFCLTGPPRGITSSEFHA